MKEITKLRLFTAVCIIVVFGLFYRAAEKQDEYYEKNIKPYDIKFYKCK